MNILRMTTQGITIMLLAMLVSGCSSGVPGDVIETAVFKNSKKPYPGYYLGHWEVSNDYVQKIDGEDFNVAEYSITYFLEDKEIEKLKKAGFNKYLGKGFDEPLIIEGRLFFVKRGSKWYSSHQGL